VSARSLIEAYIRTGTIDLTESWMQVKSLLPGITSPLFHATSPGKAISIVLNGEGLKVGSGYSNFGGGGNHNGVSMSRDLSSLLRGTFGNVVLVYDGTELRRRYKVVPYQDRSVADEFEERVLAPSIPFSLIRGVVFASRAPLRFVLEEWTEAVDFPVIYKGKAGWVATQR
jgi:hypothetical protein